MTRAISTRNGEAAYLRAPERKKAPVTMKAWQELRARRAERESRNGR